MRNEMKNFISLIWPNKNDPEIYAEKISKKLVLFTLNSAFKVFKDSEFKRFFNFTKQPGEERDRLFNELGLTSICLLLFVIEDISYLNDEERYFWQDVKEKIPVFFKKWFLSLGIEKNNVNIWNNLIDRRYNEYQRCQVKYRQIKNNYDKDFANDENERLKDFYIRYQAVSIGSLFHFRKRGTDTKDPLLKYLKTWLSVLNGQIEKKVKI